MVTGGHGEEIDSPTNAVEVEHQGACRRRFGGSLTAGGTEAYRYRWRIQKLAKTRAEATINFNSSI
jgi:hypothetical protein